MKQLITILALVFTIHQANAQTNYYAHQATKGTWSSYSQKFVWGTPNNETIRFTFNGYVISVGDKANSIYTTSTQTIDKIDSDGGHEYGWQATDQNGISCIFKLINYSDGSKLILVVYSDYAFMYVV